MKKGECVRSEMPRMPLVDALRAYVAKKPIRLHVPGHAGISNGALDQARDNTGHSLYPIDVTELPGLDHLHAADGVIAEAQTWAATAYGAKHSFFVVGGSTAGILGALHAVARAGDVVLMPRNVHQAAIHALILFGIGVVFLDAQSDPSTGTYTTMAPEQVTAVLQEHPQIKAIYLTNPNYYGVAVDVQPFVKIAHAHGIPLIVDEAHGAHFSFHPRFPRSAISQGADITIQSTHKMLPALTMGAMVHLQGDIVPAERIQKALRRVQTSSPSYVIMASLDGVRAQIQHQKEAFFHQGVAVADHFASLMKKSEHQFAICDHGKSPPPLGHSQNTYDPFKVLIYDRTGCWTGHEMYDQLAARNIFLEMADDTYAVAVLGVHSTIEDVTALSSALRDIAAGVLPNSRKKREEIGPADAWRRAHALVPPTDPLVQPIYLCDPPEQGTRNVLMECAVDTRCAQTLTPYPPGIPLLHVGERIKKVHVDRLNQLRKHNVRIVGLEDPQGRYVRVYSALT